MTEHCCGALASAKAEIQRLQKNIADLTAMIEDMHTEDDDRIAAIKSAMAEQDDQWRNGLVRRLREILEGK